MTSRPPFSIDKLEELCQVYDYVSECPVLFFLWYRQYPALKKYFSLNISVSHLQDVWNKYITWCEQLLSLAFELRIYVLQYREETTYFLNHIEEHHRILIQHVIDTITDFIDNFIQICSSPDPFWSQLVNVKLVNCPYIEAYARIAHSSKQISV